MGPGTGLNGDELMAVTNDWVVAIVSNDAARIAALMADEWVIVSDSGISERGVPVAGGERRAHALGDGARRRRPRAHLRDAAVATGRVTNTAHYRGRRFDADEWTTDVFVRRDGRWLCVLTHITDRASG
jgi:Domain of unknown function (DUF4440)